MVVCVKTISVIIILMYLILPATCFAYPCDLHSEVAPVSVDLTAFEQTNEAPDRNVEDSCDSACCCADCPIFGFITISDQKLAHKYHPYLYLAPKEIYLSIFAPPQNHS